MAIDSSTVWEVRTTGSQNNGGGFADLNPGTSVDYSQQAAAQLSPSDLATSGAASTTLTSATGGFTAAMEGNVIHITSGTNFTAGWYQITGYTDTNTVTLDRTPTPGGAGSSGQGYVGGAFLIGGSLDDDFAEQIANGNVVYIKSGTYTLGEIMSRSADATATLPIKWIGYDTSRASRPTGTSRPLIQCGSHCFGVRDYNVVENLRFTGTYDGVFWAQTAAYGRVVNCKAENSSGTPYRAAFYGDPSATFIGCEGISTSGNAFRVGHMFMCYAHDSDVGFYDVSETALCIADTCTTYGIYGSREVLQSTVYNCGTGIFFSISNNAINCIIQGCTTGVNSLGEWDTVVVAFCTLYDNATDFGANADECVQISNRTANPGMNDPANGDFSITSGDDVYQQGLDVQLWTGATVR